MTTAAHTDPDSRRTGAFPATSGERAFGAAVISLPLACLLGGIVAFAESPATGAIIGAVVLVALTAYIAHFLAGAEVTSEFGTPDARVRAPADLPSCIECGAAFVPRRSNQKYCSPPCRSDAALARRRSARNVVRSTVAANVLDAAD
jgi:hypothetical protein